MRSYAKLSLIVVSLAAVLLSVGARNDSANQIEKLDHYLLHDECSGLLNEQINLELYASIVYLNMAAYFDRPTVARNGYAKFFKDQSLEEYNHAAKFIDYINSRNATVSRISIEEAPKASWDSPQDALMNAIKLEKHVYSKLQYIHSVADQRCQDAHLMDFLETYYFTEQVDSIHELQTMLAKISVADPSAAAVIEHITDEKYNKKSSKKMEL